MSCRVFQRLSGRKKYYLRASRSRALDDDVVEIVLPRASSSLRQRWRPFHSSPDFSLVDSRNCPPNFDNSAVVYRDVVSEEEEATLIEELRGRLKRRRYERGHWDAVIIKYKEIELSDGLSESSKGVLERIRKSILEPNHLTHKNKLDWLPCHAIDLHRDGELHAHVDSVRFSGDLVAGLSLQSASIMRLKPDTNGEEANDERRNDEVKDPNSDEEGFVDLFLPPRSLYALTGTSRYRYTHELLPDGSAFGSTIVRREERLSIIFRDAKDEDDHFEVK